MDDSNSNYTSVYALLLAKLLFTTWLNLVEPTQCGLTTKNAFIFFQSLLEGYFLPSLSGRLKHPTIWIVRLKFHLKWVLNCIMWAFRLILALIHDLGLKPFLLPEVSSTTCASWRITIKRCTLQVSSSVEFKSEHLTFLLSQLIGWAWGPKEPSLSPSTGRKLDKQLTRQGLRSKLIQVLYSGGKRFY